LQECKGSRVGIHTASPGMVLTDLLLRYINLSNFRLANSVHLEDFFKRVDFLQMH
jgi:chlorophyll(ide) b reductase